MKYINLVDLFLNLSYTIKRYYIIFIFMDKYTSDLLLGITPEERKELDMRLSKRRELKKPMSAFEIFIRSKRGEFKKDVD